MTTSEQIRVLCVRSGVSLSELARRINQTPQNFSVKLKRNTVTQDELNQIANVLNVKYLKSINCERNDSGISAFFKTILGKYISSANLLHRSALVILLVFLMSSNNCNSFSLFNPLTRADGLYFLITFIIYN